MAISTTQHLPFFYMLLAQPSSPSRCVDHNRPPKSTSINLKSLPNTVIQPLMEGSLLKVVAKHSHEHVYTHRRNHNQEKIPFTVAFVCKCYNYHHHHHMQKKRKYTLLNPTKMPPHGNNISDSLSKKISPCGTSSWNK